MFLRQISARTPINQVTFCRLLSKVGHQVADKADHQPVRVENDVEKLKPSDPDVFGSMSKSGRYQRLKAEYLPDDDDGYDKLEINRITKYHSHYEYKLVKLVHSRPTRIKEAFDLVEEMRKKDRHILRPHHFTLLIKACSHYSHVYFTRIAFKLFDLIKKNRLKPTDATVTALFNCCAECDDKKYGLEQAEFLRHWVTNVSDTINLNQKHYHAMIKAFGKLGDLTTAFSLVDEMRQNRISTNSETFAMLLIGCNSDKDTGLANAIKIIRLMIHHNISLTIYTFNLLLRAVRDCGLGTKQHVDWLFGEWLKLEQGQQQEKSFFRNKRIDRSKVQWIPIGKACSLSTVETKPCLPDDSSNDVTALVPQKLEYPNFLAPTCDSARGLVVNINFDRLTKRRDKLQLIGGVDGILKMMVDNNVKPTISTLSLLLDSVSQFDKQENDLILKLREFNVKPDTDFFNLIIKRRCMRNDIESAKKVLNMIHSYGLQVNIMTFGVLALGCTTFNLAKQFIADMDASGFKFNQEISGALMATACRVSDFWYIIRIMNLMKDENITLSRRTLEAIELARINASKLIVESERNAKLTGQEQVSDSFKKSFSAFNMFYKNWLNVIVLDNPEKYMSQFKNYNPLESGRKDFDAFEEVMKKAIKNRFNKDSIEPLKVSQNDLGDNY